MLVSSATKVLAALVLKHHSETEHSDVYRNLKTHSIPISVGSICSGTVASFDCNSFGSCDTTNGCHPMFFFCD